MVTKHELGGRPNRPRYPLLDRVIRQREKRLSHLMIKTGIYQIDQLLRGERQTCFRRELKNISITLYDQLDGQPRQEEFAERILQLFADVRGAYKRTYGRRFVDFDSMVVRQLAEHFDPAQSLVVADVAVSDARTSADFFLSLAASFPRLDFQASDYDPEVFVVESGKNRVTVDRENRLLEIVYPPFVFNLMKRDSYRHYPVNHVVRWLATRWMARPLVARFVSGQLAARRIELFDPRARELARRDPRFRLGRHDLLQPFAVAGQTHVIRAMNVLNPSYFQARELGVVLGNIHTALVAGGWLITGSNEGIDTPIDGGLYRKSAQGFELLAVSAAGSPVAEQLERFSPESPARAGGS